MSDLNDFLKAVAEEKAKDPVVQKVKEVKANIQEDLGGLFSQIAVIKEQDPVAQQSKKIEKQVQESVKMDLGELFTQLTSLKTDLEKELVVAEAKQEQAIINEIAELVAEETLTEEIPAQPTIKTPEERIAQTNADVNKYLSGKSFQQPEPDLVAKNVEDIRNKIKFLEQAIGRIAATGPGGGEVNLRWLDDVDRSTIGDNKYLRYNDTKKKFEFVTLSGSGEPQVQSDWAETDDTQVDYIKNKPTLFSGDYDDLTNKPTIPAAQVNSDWNAESGVEQILNKPTLFSGSYNDLTNKPTIPAAQIQSDWNQADNTALDFIKNKPSIPDIGPIEDVLAATGEPMGHQDRTESTISFDNTSRTFTISPASTEFNVWVKGTKYTYTTSQSVTLPNTSGLYYIYFDSSGIGYQTTFYTWDQQAMTAYVYYNAETGVGYVFDERHGITLDWQTHEYLHRTHGALYSSGFAVSNYTLMGDGSSNSHCTLDLAGGTFFDEDNQIDIVHSNTPTANTFQQDLQGPAQIPIFYKNSTGAWVLDAATDYPMKLGTDRPQYNLNSGGNWSTADIDNNKYGVTFIIATNMINTPVIGILGQSARDNIGDAESYNLSDLDLTGFPVVEMRLLYRVVYDCKTSYTNTPSARIDSIWDLRVTTTTSTNVTTGDHGSLTGLLDDDHTQYLLRTDAATVATSGSYEDLIDLPTSISWTNPSPAVGTNFKTILASNDGTATITLLTDLPGIGSSYVWTFDKDKITFPDSSTQTTAYTGNASTVTNGVYTTGTYSNPTWITSLAGSKVTNAVLTTDTGTVTNAMLAGSIANSKLTNSSVTINGTSISLGASGTVTAAAGTLTGTSLNSTVVSSSLTSLGTLNTLTLAQSSTVVSNMATDHYFDVGGHGKIFDDGNTHIHTSVGDLWLASLEAGRYVQINMQGSGAGLKVGGDTISTTPYLGKTPFNSALDTVVSVDNLKYRISNQGGVFPQVASVSGSSVDICWSIVGVVSGAGTTSAENSGTLVTSFTSLYTTHGMDTRGDSLVAHVTDKNAGKIYRVTFIVANNSSNTTGYNIIAERII